VAAEVKGLFSRPVRLAAHLTGGDEAMLENLFTEARVLVHMEEAFSELPDAREAFLFTVNQTLRFCPNVSLCVPPATTQLIDLANEIADRVHGRGCSVQIACPGNASQFDAVINIGTEIAHDLPWTTVNSTGWVARVAGPGSGTDRLLWLPDESNPIGALAAATLGTGRAFLFLVGRPLRKPAVEISLFTYQVSSPGALHPGPRLPVRPINLQGLVVGCGAVTNGWAYAIKRLPIQGEIDAIDKQALRIENVAPYVAASREWIDKSKAEMIAALLSPAIKVTPRPEEWELFKIRLRYGLQVPPIVVNGLDNVETRHSVQRLWPDALIDMAAGGLTSQVITKAGQSESICLLRALDRTTGEIGWAERLAQETGLRVERILDEPTSAITEADVAAAPEEKRTMLDTARREGQLLCGRITEQNLRFEGPSDQFAPAVPFVTAFSGVVGAAETMKWLMGYRALGLHFQHSFASGQSRRLSMQCAQDCECRFRNKRSSAR
jgi:hypothetical protein